MRIYEIDADARELELDNRNECVRYGRHLLNGILGCHAVDDFRKVFEKIFTLYVFGSDNESVNVGA